MNAPDIRFETLLERRDVLDEVARWIHGQWASRSMEATRRQLANPGLCPPTLLAFLEQNVVGVLGFARYPQREQAPPALWINSLFVAEPARGQGIGAALVRWALVRARELERVLYVYTESPGFYERLGWQLVHGPSDDEHVVLKHDTGSESGSDERNE